MRLLQPRLPEPRLRVAHICDVDGVRGGRWREAPAHRLDRRLAVFQPDHETFVVGVDVLRHVVEAHRDLDLRELVDRPAGDRLALEDRLPVVIAHQLCSQRDQACTSCTARRIVATCLPNGVTLPADSRQQ